MVTFKNTSIFFVNSLLFLLLILTGCGKSAEKKAEEAMPVRAVEVTRGTLNETIFYVGDINAEYEAVVYPKVTGRIIEVVTQESHYVKQGDALVFIDRDEVGFEFKKAPVESPIEGVVGRIYVTKGMKVSPQTEVALVVKMDVVKVRIEVTEKDLPVVKEGQHAYVEVSAYPEEKFEGTVMKVSPVIDKDSRTAPVEITLPNIDNRLKPGMFGRIDVMVDKKEDILIIPKDAVMVQENAKYVFAAKDNKAYRRDIITGIMQKNQVEVLSGLQEGELVVTMGNARIKEGDKLNIVQ